MLRISATLLALALTGCGTAPPVPPQGTLSMQEFMGHVMFPTAERLWAWSALEIDRNGERYTRPKTPAEWEAAESDALTIQQMAIVLAQPSYRVDDAGWDRQLAGLRDAATASAKAAEAQDFPALLTAGNRLNERCVSCHTAFAPQLEVIPTPPAPAP